MLPHMGSYVSRQRGTPPPQPIDISQFHVLRGWTSSQSVRDDVMPTLKPIPAHNSSQRDIKHPLAKNVCKGLLAKVSKRDETRKERKRRRERKRERVKYKHHSVRKKSISAKTEYEEEIYELHTLNIQEYQRTPSNSFSLNLFPLYPFPSLSVFFSHKTHTALS